MGNPKGASIPFGRVRVNTSYAKCLVYYLKGRMRNILFILVDCLRADAIWGAQRRTVTPTIDRLMQRGTYFSQAISTTSTTTPCVASMLTGNYPFSHGIRTLSGYKLNSECVTLPQVLKKAGYHTYAMVTGPLSPITGLDRGFDEYEYRTKETYLSDGWGENLRRKFRQRELREPWFVFLHLWEITQAQESGARVRFETIRQRSIRASGFQLGP